MLIELILMLIVLGVIITDIIILSTIQKLQNIKVSITTPEPAPVTYQEIKEYPDKDEDEATKNAIRDVAGALQSFMLDEEDE